MQIIAGPTTHLSIRKICETTELLLWVHKIPGWIAGTVSGNNTWDAATNATVGHTDFISTSVNDALVLYSKTSPRASVLAMLLLLKNKDSIS